MTTYNPETTAHLVQQALTPVFLLSGIATLLNVFASRLARVSDQAHSISTEPQDEARDRTARALKRRTRALDAAVVLAALAGALTCAAVLVLFIGAVFGAYGANLLFIIFGAAIILTMGALAAFVVEMLLATRGVRNTVDRQIAG